MNEKTDLKCGDLSQKLNDSEKQYEEACTNLQMLITNGDSLFTNEIKRRNMSREREIEKLKLEGDEINKKYINLLTSQKKMTLRDQ